MLQCCSVAVLQCCRVVKCGAECCSVLCQCLPNVTKIWDWLTSRRCEGEVRELEKGGAGQKKTHTHTRTHAKMPACGSICGLGLCCIVLQGSAGCCSILQCVAVCCNVLQRVAMCCSTG